MILQSAVHDAVARKTLSEACKSMPASQVARDCRAALAWIRSDARHFGSFLWICDLLGLHPEAIRERLSDASQRYKIYHRAEKIRREADAS